MSIDVTDEMIEAAFEAAVNGPSDLHRKAYAIVEAVAPLIEAQARAEIEDFQKCFDLRWNADMRAIKRWQEANPGNDLVWPDHADLCVWLLDRLAEAKALIADLIVARDREKGFYEQTRAELAQVEAQALERAAKVAENAHNLVFSQPTPSEGFVAAKAATMIRALASPAAQEGLPKQKRDPKEGLSAFQVLKDHFTPAASPAAQEDGR